ncbi:MAG: SpoIIE family protein phosphatase [Bacilli bacterium]|nr:SpoIIE family protein phosphatase [Bacilli bacterium]
MIVDFLKLFLIALVPIVIATGIIFLQRNTKFKKLDKRIQDAIIITLFSISCILGTVFGVEARNGALINVRDASPIIAGLMFGGPVGVIVGFVGGLYRFISVYWGGSGAYVQIACAVSTFMAGVFTLIVRRFIFNNKRGKWYYGLFLVLLCEDFHMLLVFLTHLNDIQGAYIVVKDCVGLMVLANSLAVVLAMIIASFIYKEKFFEHEKPQKISTTIQVTLLIFLTIAYSVVSSVSYFSTKNVSTKNNEWTLQQNVKDLRDDVDNLIDEELLEICEIIKDNVAPIIASSGDLNAAMTANLSGDGFSISEVHLIGNDNVIKYSSNPVLVNYDMSSNEQSKAFECLLHDKEFFSQPIMQPGSNEAAGNRMKYAGIKLDSNSSDLSYLQVGINEEKYHNLLDEKVQRSAHYRHIGNKGFIIVANPDGTVISTVYGGNVTSKIGLSTLKLNEMGKYQGKEGNFEYNFYTYAEYVEGYYIIALADVEESDLSSNITLATISLTEIFAFLILYGILYIVIKHRVVDSIVNVGKSLTKITKGDFDIKVHENKSKEFKELSRDINRTVNSLKKYADEEKKKIESELQFAKNIQHSALPTVFPLNNNFRIFANMVTAKAVGGDFYDFYYIDRDTVAILIADVSGKGIPAAMFMMKSKTVIKGLVESGMPVHIAATEANKKLCEGNDANMFVTAWLGAINIKTGHVDFVNAGHNPPLIQNDDGSFEYLQSKKGFVFAGIDGFTYEKQSFDLKPGQKIYLYTDGVTEATNINKELYGEDRLLKLINGHKNSIPKDICDAVIEGVNDFVGDAEQADDITMLCFQYIDQENETSRVFDAKIENVEAVTEFVDKYLADANCAPKAETQINVAIDEIFSNICLYAYKENMEARARVGVTFDPSKENVTITFEDRGVPYNPLEKEDPNVNASIEDRSVGGLGIYIVKQTMDDVVYSFDNGHNILKITKNIK